MGSHIGFVMGEADELVIFSLGYHHKALFGLSWHLQILRMGDHRIKLSLTQ
jgi:hypothetical protein